MKKLLVILTLVFALGIGACAEARDNKRGDSVGSYLPLTGEGLYSGNVKTKKYHNSDCKFFDCRDCTKKFKSAEAAQKAGYVACGKCGG